MKRALEREVPNTTNREVDQLTLLKWKQVQAVLQKAT
jgi:hypothetical protein